jgi:hypothetical protein
VKVGGGAAGRVVAEEFGAPLGRRRRVRTVRMVVAACQQEGEGWRRRRRQLRRRGWRCGGHGRRGWGRGRGRGGRRLARRGRRRRGRRRVRIEVPAAARPSEGGAMVADGAVRRVCRETRQGVCARAEGRVARIARIAAPCSISTARAHVRCAGGVHKVLDEQRLPRRRLVTRRPVGVRVAAALDLIKYRRSRWRRGLEF